MTKLEEQDAEIERLAKLYRASLELLAEQGAAAGELANELAQMHGAMFNLILRLYKTQLSPTQAALVATADAELAASQKRFFVTHGDSIGGGAPERN